MSRKIITLGRYQVDEVLPFTGPKAPHKTYYTKDGKRIRVKMRSLRYQTFAKDLSCVCCGIKGMFFALQRYPNESEYNAHFNLYAINEHGHHVLMTKDHITPRSKGGKDHVDNMQTMCSNCNGWKKDHPITVEQLQQLRLYRLELGKLKGAEKLNKKQITKLVDARIREILKEVKECASSPDPSNTLPIPTSSSETLTATT